MKFYIPPGDTSLLEQALAQVSEKLTRKFVTELPADPEEEVFYINILTGEAQLYQNGRYISLANQTKQYQVTVKTTGQTQFNLTAVAIRQIQEVRLSGIPLVEHQHYTLSATSAGEKTLNFLVPYITLNSSDRLEVFYV